MMRALPVPVHIRALVLYMAYMFGVFTLVLMGIPVALPAFIADFNVGVSTAAWVMVAYTLGLAAGTFPVGRISGVLDRKKLMLYSMVMDVALMGVIILTGSIYIVIVARFFQAMMQAVPWLNLQTRAMASFPVEKRGKVLGITMASQGIAFIIAAPVTAFVVANFGWRWLFVGMSGWTLLIMALIWLTIPSEEVPQGGRPKVSVSSFDFPGIALMMLGIVSLLLALQFITKGLSPSLMVAFGGIATVSLIAFVWTELHTKTPVLLFSLFKTRGVLMGTIQALFVGFSNGGIMLLLPFLFRSGYGWSLAVVGNAILFLALARPATGPAAGWLADRLGTAKIIIPAGILVVGSQLILASLGVSTAFRVVAGVLLVWGIGFSIVQTVNLRQLYTSLPKQYLHMAPSANLVMGTFGTTVSQAVLAVSLDKIGAGAVVVEGTANAAVASGIATLLVILAGVFAAGIVLAQLLPRLLLKRAEESQPAEQTDPV